MGRNHLMKTNQQKLDNLAQELKNLKVGELYQLRKRENYKPVIGEGKLDADIMLVGEAPGQTEAETGRPFVGRGGKLLTKILKSIGINRSDIYITNIVKDRPPGNRKPTKEEIEKYRPILEKEIQMVEPAIIVTVGKTATDFFFETYKGQKVTRLGDIRGQVLPLEISPPAGGLKFKILPTYHPAYGLRNPPSQKTIRKDLAKLKPFYTSA